MENQKPLLVTLFLGSNHLNNIRTLQSIYRQVYGNIMLVLYNDALDFFESERFFYNINAQRPEGVQQVFFVENCYPVGETAAMQDILKRFNPEYVYVLHSGDVLREPKTLSVMVEGFEKALYADALVTYVEEWDARFAHKLATRTMLEQAEDIELLEVIDSPMWSSLRDSMFVYKADVLRDVLDSAPKGRTVMQTAVAELIRRHDCITRTRIVSCKYINEENTQEKQAIPSFLGNEQLMRISRSSKQNNGETVTQEQQTKSVKACSAWQIGRNRRNKLLFHLSTVKKIAAYVAITAFFIAMAFIFFMFQHKVATVLGCLSAVAAVLAGAWSVFMVGCRVYFKNKPERLIANDDV